MADRGRDLKIAVISDTDKFDTSDAAKDLEKLGKEALDAGKDLDKASQDLESFGKDADSTAKKVDSAFEKIAASSRSNLRKVDNDTDKAAKGLDDFKDESSSTAREAAASFSGEFTDIADTIQEVAANAFAGFGKLGGIAGIAAAAGIGVVVNQINAANEKIKELRSNWRSVFENTDTTSVDKMNQAISDIQDAGINLEDLKRNLKDAGISVKDYLDAYVNGGPDLERVNRKLVEQGSSLGGLAGLLPGLSHDSQNYYDILNDGRKAIEGESQAQDVRNEVLGKSTAEVAANTKAQEANKSALDATKSSLSETGDAVDTLNSKIEDGKDAITIKDITKALAADAKAKKDHLKNLKLALDEGGAQFEAWLAQQPADYAAAYAKGSAKERSAFRKAAQENIGAEMGAGVALGLDAQKPAVKAKAGELYTAVKSELTGETIYLPVGFRTPSAGEAAAVRARMRRQLAQPLTIPVTYQDVGNYRKVP